MNFSIRQYSVESDELVGLAAHADGFRVVEGVHAVAGVDALDEVDLAVVIGGTTRSVQALSRATGSREARMPMSPIRGSSGEESQSQSTDRLLATLM